MNDSHRFQLTQHGFVEKFLDPRDRFVGVRADDVQLGKRTFARLQVHVDADAGRLRADRCGRRDDAKFVDACPESFAANIHFRLAIVQ